MPGHRSHYKMEDSSLDDFFAKKDKTKKKNKSKLTPSDILAQQETGVKKTKKKKDKENEAASEAEYLILSIKRNKNKLVNHFQFICFFLKF
jgi:hypothetical protein